MTEPPHRLATVVLVALLGVLLAACGSVPSAPGTVTTTAPGSGIEVDTRYSSANQDSRVLFLVLHYTVADLPTSIKVLTEPKYEVSAHYLLTDETPPRIYRLVPEDRRAWHSGASAWRGHSMLNANSIGIEIVHPGFREAADGTREYLPFPQAQIDALLPLVKDIVGRHGIRPERIVGHSDVLPQMKEDPGPTFPWKRLADEGLIPWPDAARVAEQRARFAEALPTVEWFQKSLSTHGYTVPQHGKLDAATRRVIGAFQMRFRPQRFDGVPDAETAALLQVLITPAAR